MNLNSKYNFKYVYSKFNQQDEFLKIQDYITQIKGVRIICDKCQNKNFEIAKFQNVIYKIWNAEGLI